MIPLTLKYRPKRFEDFTGQILAVSTLRRSVREGRIFPVVILAGGRGSGKTSLARTYAMALSCPNRTGEEPCGACSSCMDISSGKSLDVLEVDAATTRGIDSIRKIKDSARYLPSGRYRVFILDEAHSLTREAWESLLKLLEEPPEHVIFIFATTEPKKIPDTIESRALVLPFFRLTSSEVEERLRVICRLEGIMADAESIEEIARAGEGSLRDSVKILEQAAASGEPISVGAMKRMRLVGDPEGALALVRLWSIGEIAPAFTYAKRVYEECPDVGVFYEQLSDVLLYMAMSKHGVRSVDRYGEEMGGDVDSIAAAVSYETVWRWRKIVTDHRINLEFTTPFHSLLSCQMEVLAWEKSIKVDTSVSSETGFAEDVKQKSVPDSDLASLFKEFGVDK